MQAICLLIDINTLVIIISSYLLPIKSGIGQGFLVRRLIFLIFINDLLNSTVLQKFMFAGDTTLLLANKNINELFAIINSELQLVYNWFYDNKLSINLVKTSYLLFTNSAHNANHVVLLNDGSIEKQTKTKFLSVITDDKLTWRDHINCLLVKLSRDVALMKVASRYFSNSCLLTLYSAFFQ